MRRTPEIHRGDALRIDVYTSTEPDPASGIPCNEPFPLRHWLDWICTAPQQASKAMLSGAKTDPRPLSDYPRML